MLIAHKAHTNGNDFILIEGPQKAPAKIAKQIAHRRTGIGCDQVLFFVKNGHTAEVTFYNQDGSKADLCLNGVFALANHLAKQSPLNWKITTTHHTFTCQTNKQPLTIAFHQSIVLDYHPVQKTYIEETPNLSNALFISVGNHHLILPTADIQPFDLSGFASVIQKKGYFPDGINISTFQPHDTMINMQTYERGAGLTLGCGSAALAVFIHQLKNNPNQTRVIIKQPGGTVKFEKNNNTIYMQAQYESIAAIEVNC